VTILPALAIENSAPALPAADLEAAAAFARQEKAPATRRAYRSDFQAFRVFCLSRGVDALPASPETVAAYLAHEAESGRAASTITRRCAAIRYAHRLADFEPPTNSESVRATLRGIRRAVGAASERKAPVLAETARAMALSAPEGLKGLRDRALLLLASQARFAGLSWSASMSPISRKPTMATRSPSAGPRPTRKATVSRSPSCTGTTPVPSRP
jgi:hypothetical protein